VYVRLSFTIRCPADYIQDTLNCVNSATVEEIAAFLDDAAKNPHIRCIPTGIISTGASLASHTEITHRLAQRQSDASARRILVSLHSESGSNLKALLKTLILKATSLAVEDDEDEEVATSEKRKGRRLLNYDLQLLADYVQEHDYQQVVVAFEDTEGFESNLLSELIEMLSYWQDRIPFVCLLSIATSVDFLQQRLSKAAVQSLDGRMFDLAPAREAVEQVFETLTDSGAILWIGPTLAGMALERQNDYIQSSESFVDAVQYAYMSHYYANALSVFLEPTLSSKDISHDHFEALRSLESFRDWARQQLDNHESLRVKDMLESDIYLLEMAKSQIREGQHHMGNIIRAIDIVRVLQRKLPNTTVSARSSLYVQALSGKLGGSALVRTLLLLIRKQPSDVALNIILAVLKSSAGGHHALRACSAIVNDLNKLLRQQKDSTEPLRSEDDVKNSTLRTTVVAQKVELSKQKSALSDVDTAYTAILRRFSDSLDSFFESTLIDPKTLPFHEVFLYDLKSPHREAFTPRPRHAVERALAAPHDYLDCDCCAPANGDREEVATLSATQPATAVLYQLYLESGSLINVSDLLHAFQSFIADHVEDGEGMSMALFQRALAELKALGMVKSSRKRVDHIAKIAWRGL